MLLRLNSSLQSASSVFFHFHFSSFYPSPFPLTSSVPHYCDSSLSLTPPLVSQSCRQCPIVIVSDLTPHCLLFSLPRIACGLHQVLFDPSLSLYFLPSLFWHRMAVGTVEMFSYHLSSINMIFLLLAFFTEMSSTTVQMHLAFFVDTLVSLCL